MSTTSKIPDELILAAIDRAIRHRARDGGVPVWVILDHLSLPRRSRRAVAQIDALGVAGSLACSRQYGRTVWTLTSTGRRRLQRAMRSGDLPGLPESPQHRAWREARALAEQKIEGFAQKLIDTVSEAMECVERDSRSDALLEIGERLRFEFRRLASATYCLTEWAEPDDATADIDDGLEPAERALDRAERARLSSRRAGRRNPLNWERGRA